MIMPKQEYIRIKRSKHDKLIHERDKLKRDLAFAKNMIINQDTRIERFMNRIKELEKQKEPTIWELILRKLRS